MRCLKKMVIKPKSRAKGRMKQHLIIAIIVAGALLAGMAAIGLGLSTESHNVSTLRDYATHGLVAFWLGVVGAIAYLFANKDR